MTAVTPWRLSRLSVGSSARLAFGRMHEDAAIEEQRLHGRIVSIASAGDTAFALAAGGENHVTAIDVNAAQADYVRERLDGGRVRPGTVDRLMSVGRRLAGWHVDELERFADLDDPQLQAAIWRSTFDTPRFRAAMATLIPFGLLLRARPGRLDRELRTRLLAGWGTHPNRTNPFARLILLGADSAPIAPRSIINPISVVAGDAAAHLEGLEPGSIDGFALSNILDAAGRAYGRRLAAAVRRAAAPGATVVLRGLGGAHTHAEELLARQDRSHIWGRIAVGGADVIEDW